MKKSSLATCRICAVFLLALLLAFGARANSLTTIPLKSRTAEEIIPVVEPMLGPGEAITGRGFKIFLRSSQETLQQVREMIDALDVAAKMLRISVFQGSERELESLAISGNVEIESGNASIGIGSSQPGSAGSVSVGSGNARAAVDMSAVSERRESGPVHQLRVAEGSEGFIQAGEQIPYLTGGGNSRSASLEFKDATTGFYVLPRVNGDRVTLRINPFKRSRSADQGGSIAVQQADTTITGPLGEWLRLGGISEQFERSQSGIASRSNASGRAEDSIWIRADLLR